MQKVYAELVFLDNFTVNLLIILLAGLLTRATRRWGRYALAATLGGVYACIAFGVSAVGMLPVRVCVGVAMGFIAFRARGERGAWRSVCAFWAASFMLAGAIYAVSAAFGETATAGGVMIVRPPTRAILLGLLTGAVTTAVLAHIRRRTQQRAQNTAVITLAMGKRHTQVKALIDTGNLAREPLTGLSVIFLSHTAAAELLEMPLLKLLDGNAMPETDRLRIVPCDTASGGGVFCGIEIDSAALKGAAKGARAVVCLSQRPLPDGCGAIIGGNLMDELEKGAQNEDSDVDAQTGSMGDAAAEAKRVDSVHRRQRGASPAADARGGGHAAGSAGPGRQDGEARAD